MPDTFTFGKVISQEYDMAKKYRVTVSITDGKEERWLMLKFHHVPVLSEVQSAAQIQIELLNNPPPVPPTYEELKTQIAIQAKLIITKDAQIAVLSQAVKP